MDKKKQDKTERYNISKVTDTISRQDKQGLGKKIAECLNKDGECEVNVSVISASKKTEEIITVVNFALDKNISFTSEVTPFDIGVMDAIYSICKDGTMEFIVEDVVRYMRGNTEKTVNLQAVNAVVASIKKLRHIDVIIDCTEEYKKRKVLKNNERRCELRSYLLPVDIAEVERNNHKIVSGYRLLDIPALYKYAEKIGQIISVPMKLLQIEGVTDTTDVILIKRSLITRIEQMKNVNNRVKSKKIIFERKDHENGETTGFFVKLGFCQESYSSYDSWKRKRRQLCDVTFKILDEWVKNGYIKNYSIIKERKKNIGVEISF